MLGNRTAKVSTLQVQVLRSDSTVRMTATKLDGNDRFGDLNRMEATIVPQIQTIAASARVKNPTAVLSA